MANEIDRILSQYGQGYEAPQLNSGDAEIYSTPNILSQYASQTEGIPGWLRSTATRIRGDSRPDNVLAGGMDTAANWLDGRPRVGEDTVAPLGLAGMGLPFAVPGAVGIFGGRLARTADQDALRRAEEMAASGADRRAIWNQTGWFQGRDGQWRFEISDERSGFHMPTNAEGVPQGVGRLPAYLTHRDFYNAYPNARDTQVVTSGNPGASFSGDWNSTRFGEGALMQLGQPRDMRHVMALHELQHGIQRTEGFAPGWNPRDAAMPQIETINARLREIARELDQYRRPGTSRDFNDPRGYQLAEEYDQLMSQRGSVSGQDLYHRSAGEVEARNVMRRADLSPQERRARPPWETQDVPDADQILSRYGSGPQMSVPRPEPRTEMEAFDLLPARVRAALQDRQHSALELATLQRIGLSEDDMLRWMGAAPPRPSGSFALTPDMLRTMVERDPTLIPQRQRAVERARADLAANPSNAGLRAMLADAEADLAELLSARNVD